MIYAFVILSFSFCCCKFLIWVLQHWHKTEEESRNLSVEKGLLPLTSSAFLYLFPHNNKTSCAFVCLFHHNNNKTQTTSIKACNAWYTWRAVVGYNTRTRRHLIKLAMCDIRAVGYKKPCFHKINDADASRLFVLGHSCNIGLCSTTYL